MVVIQCPHCGKQVSNLATKCPHCGKIIERAGGAPGYVAPRPQGSLVKTLAGLVVVVAVLAAIAYYVLPRFGINLF